jgi:hypothetical protein
MKTGTIVFQLTQHLTIPNITTNKPETAANDIMDDVTRYLKSRYHKDTKVKPYLSGVAFIEDEPPVVYPQYCVEKRENHTACATHRVVVNKSPTTREIDFLGSKEECEAVAAALSQLRDNKKADCR